MRKLMSLLIGEMDINITWTENDRWVLFHVFDP